MSEPLRPADLDQLSAALDGELPAAEQAALDRLLPVAPELRAELDRLAAVQRLTRRAVNNLPLPDGLFGRLQAALDDAAPPAPVAAPRLLPQRRRRLWTVLAVAATTVLAVLALHRGGRPDDAPQPLVAGLVLDPAQLATTHAAWQEHFAATTTTATPRDMADRLATRLGYAVRPPDLAALDATLRGCATCNHSVPGRDVAVFVLRRRGGRPLSLYEFRAPRSAVQLAGFQPTARPGFAAASRGGLTYLTWADGDLRACLVAADSSVEELLPLAPRALQVAGRPTSPRIASRLVALGATG